MRVPISGVTDLMKKIVVKKDGNVMESDKRLKYRVDGNVCTLMAKTAICDDTGVYSLSFSDVDGQFGITNVNVQVLQAGTAADKAQEEPIEAKVAKSDEASVDVTDAKDVTTEVASPGIEVVVDCSNVDIDEGKTLVLRWTITGEF